MRQALRLAARGVGHTRPNPVVGCLIVRTDAPAPPPEKNGAMPPSAPPTHPTTHAQTVVVGKGYHHRAGEAHAEPLALRQAGLPLPEPPCHTTRPPTFTAYVTLEPCSHHGRTPPCADALIRAGVARVVVAMEDPNPRVSGKGIQRLRDAGIIVTVGVCAEEARDLNQPFVTWITQGRPLLTLKMAASLDGKTATHTGESQWITGPLARQHVQKMRSKHDLVMVGIGTVLADNPRLTCRLPSGHTPSAGRDPIRLVVDSTLKIPLNAAILTASSTADVWIATTERSTPSRREALQNLPMKEGRSVRLLLCRTTPSGHVDLTDLLHQLGTAGILSILSEAGATMSAALMATGLADRLALFLAPKLIGGQAAPGLLQGKGADRLTEAFSLTKLHITPVGEDLLLEGAFPKDVHRSD